MQSINLFWLFFILKIAFNVVFREVVSDVRSDAEDEGEEDLGEKSGALAQAVIEGAESKEEGKMAKGWGIASNGIVPEGHDSYADAVVEGKKRR